MVVIQNWCLLVARLLPADCKVIHKDIQIKNKEHVTQYLSSTETAVFTEMASVIMCYCACTFTCSKSVKDFIQWVIFKLM